MVKKVQGFAVTGDAAEKGSIGGKNAAGVKRKSGFAKTGSKNASAMAKRSWEVRRQREAAKKKTTA